MGKRIHLCEYETDSLADGLNSLFDNEEALLLAKFLRNERKSWIPRLPKI
jgi:hypothetical protein